MRGESTPNRNKRNRIALLRGMLLVGIGGLLVGSSQPAGLGSLALIIVFALSNFLLLLAPLRWVSTLRFELAVGAVDVLFVALGIHLAGAGAGALQVSCLLMVLIVALGNYSAPTGAGAVAVGGLHAWLVLRAAPEGEALRQLVLQIFFLYSVGLYYGLLTESIHRFRRKQEAERLERRELNTLLEILDTITSSLDIRQMARSIVTKLTDIVPAMRCSILYVDETSTRCHVMASHDEPELDLLEIDLEKYPEVDEAIRTREPVIVRNVSNDPVVAQVREILQDLDVHSIMVIPLTFGDDVLGTLCLKSARSESDYSEREIKFCTAVARASSNALKNALLHHQVQEGSRRHRTMGEKLASILNYSPDLVLTTDNEGRITEFNRGAETLLGYRKQEVLDQPFGLLFGEEADPDLVDKILSAGVLSNYSCRLVTNNDATVDVELNMAVLKNDADQVVGTVWIGRDVSELKATQLQLLQAEKLSTIGEVISGIAHELSNPLSGVLGFSQLLMTRHSNNPMIGELEKIHNSALRCQKIVKNLLSFAREHKPERKYLGVNGILEKTLDMKKYQLHVNNIEVVREIDRSVPCTLLDFHQMQQVFLNLINNAQHAMVAVRERPGRLVVRTSHVDGTIKVEIADNGEGMDADTLRRIFDPFFTTKEQGEGTGLGLSVSYGIVKEHGGSIYARSRKGAGSTFVVELPVRKEKEETGPVEGSPDTAITVPRAEEGRRILVVDDEPVILDLLIDILEESGHRVDTASNGAEASRKVASQSYDLVITDIRMPQMDGMELYRNILSMQPDMEGRVIFITGDLISKETLQYLAEVNAPTLPKPLEVAKILDVIEKTLTRGADETSASGPQAAEA